QMLTGNLPYAGESPVTVALKHIGDPVPTLDVDGLTVSPALASIVNKLLQKRPENRFHSASEVATALREARERPSVAQYAISDDAPTQNYRSVPPPRRSPLPDSVYTSMSEDEERRSAAGGRAIVTLVILAILATGLGYVIFGRPFALPGLGASITVADYTNMADTQAEAAIVNAGLVARFVKSPSDTVEANHVIRQNPAAGAKVEKSSLVELVVSNGLPLVGLPDVRGYNVNDAQRTLEDDGFTVKRKAKFDNSAKDNVIDQQPKAGSQAHKGAVVTLVISQGPQPIEAPNFVGMSADAAVALAKSSGIAVDVSERTAYPNVPSGFVASQDVEPGQKIDHTTTIHLSISTGPAANTATVAVPNVVNARYDEAVNAINGAGFTAAVKYTVEGSANGTIVDQDPAAGTQLASGATVTITQSVSGEVPDTEGMTLADAQATLLKYGYRISKITYTASEGADGKVVRTDPSAGSQLDPGSFVTLIVNGAPP
ncbi:MAG TPA: PASTA domain-containing protein, partial [Candidatus Baltobacteraceae bacterium]|nr:PASTA domain-containing protein [Candidatus Baltobacteraceae bacterium]